MTVKDVGFFQGATRLKELEPEYIWLFMASSDQNTVERLARQRIRVVHTTQDASMFPLFHGLLAMAMWGLEEGDEPDWNEIIRKQTIPMMGPQFRSLPLSQSVHTSRCGAALRRTLVAVRRFRQSCKNRTHRRHVSRPRTLCNQLVLADSKTVASGLRLQL